MLWYDVRVDADRNQRIRGGILGRYGAQVPPPMMEADLAVLTAFIPHRQKRRTLFLWLGLAALFGIPFIGCTQATSNADGFLPIVVGVLLGIIGGPILLAFRGQALDLRHDKIETLRALVRRIDFAGGQPLNVNANLSARTRVVASQYKGPGMWTNASISSAYADEWLFLEGRLSNGIGIQLTRGSSFSANRTRHSYVASASTIVDTATLMYPPAMNPTLANMGPAVGQQIQRPPGANVEVINQPGSLSVRMTHEGPDVNRPEPLAGLLAQAVALVDRSRGYVQIDRDAWPPYMPNPAEVAAVRT
jgi:hypothetical protein